MSTERTSVLFVCLGNICRSPMARWVMIDLARDRGVLQRLDIDSCGTGDWHSGEPADPRSATCAARNGLKTDHVARQFARDDGERFEYILVMDRSNQRDVLAMGAPKHKVRLLRSFDPLLIDAHERELEVPDPYYGGEQGFEQMYQMIRRACNGLLDTLPLR
ncbi:MAG: low molecular weight phosphotyrosine protein phosphatase [Planctomycetes bacterium]|nr:low molecular weight phosphotyrosine protein phosphatase [Planctomycetota bacterium]